MNTPSRPQFFFNFFLERTENFQQDGILIIFINDQNHFRQFLLIVRNSSFVTMTMTASPSTATPLATSAASVVAPANLSNPNIATARRRPTNYNPTISAMLALSRCDDMVKMAQECLATGSNATICHTAERYMGACMDHTK